MRRLILATLALVLGGVLLFPPTTALGQTPTNEIPTQDIVPKPNSGDEPQEAGDRGGALQIAIPLVFVVAVGGAIWHLRRQSRRALDASA